MNTSKHVYLSKKGIDELKEKIIDLKNDISKTRLELYELDKHDGFEERLARIVKLDYLQASEIELHDKQSILNKAKLLPRKRDRLFVALGSVVDMIDGQGRLLRYTIVDSLEANPSDGRISANSPLGKSLIGKQIKQSVSLYLNGKSSKLKLVKIN